MAHYHSDFSICLFYLPEIRLQSNHLEYIIFLIILSSAVGQFCDDIKDDAVTASDTTDLAGMAMLQILWPLRESRLKNRMQGTHQHYCQTQRRKIATKLVHEV